MYGPLDEREGEGPRQPHPAEHYYPAEGELLDRLGDRLPHTYMHTYIHTYLHTYTYNCNHLYIHILQLPHTVHTYTLVYWGKHIYIHTYYIHTTYIHTYIHTDIQTYI